MNAIVHLVHHTFDECIIDHHAMNPAYAKEFGLALGYPQKSVEYKELKNQYLKK